MQIMVLEGGVKGWVKAGPQFTQFIDGYREEYWRDLFADEERQAREANAHGGDQPMEQGGQSAAQKRARALSGYYQDEQGSKRLHA